MLNAMGYRMRPYEVEPGATDARSDGCKRIVYDALVERSAASLTALWRAGTTSAPVKVDRLRPKPKVGDHRRVLGDDDRGRRQLPAPALPRGRGRRSRHPARSRAWLLYNIWEVRWDTKLRAWSCAARTDAASRPGGQESAQEAGACCASPSWPCAASSRRSRNRSGSAATTCRTWTRSPTVAHQYYDNHLRGGEGHMEVGKLILNVDAQARRT